VTDPAEALDRRREHFEEQLAVCVNEEDVLPRVPAACYVVDGSFVLQTQRSCHENSLADPIPERKM
jgi:hypothetical protein